MFSVLISGVRAWRERREAMREMRALDQIELAIMPMDESNPLERAKVSLGVGDLKAANYFWEQASTRYPEYVLLSRDSVNILVGLKRFDEAEALMLAGQKRFPKEGHYAEGYAMVAHRRHDLEEAARRWKVVRKKFPHRSPGFVVGAGCLRELCRFDEADALITHAMEQIPSDMGRNGMVPRDMGPALEYCRIGEARGDWTEALRRWEKFSAVHAACMMGACRALHRIGRSDEAASRLEEARPRFPLEAEIVNQLAAISRDRGDNAEALKWWKFMIERFPLNSTGYLECGRFLQKIGEYADADAVFLAARDRFPDDAWPLTEYAALANARNDWTEAATRWAAVREAFPDREDGYVRGAEAIARSGEQEQAAQLFAEHKRRFHR